ncbi:MAG: peptidyl-alpha-hydroxyglycine alpha-amidating lyase family protein [Fuerstiella sp.]|nr:peptidyl-alpha-hydroxyglycine alpha-amidating lyase family protein [Fuerstiella sp.]
MKTALAPRPTLMFFCLSIVLATESSVYAQQKPKSLPGVDYPRDNAADGYKVDLRWPQEKSSYSWKAMPGIAIDETGLVWTINRGEMPVQVYTQDGVLVRQWGRGYFSSPHQIRFGHQGHVWVADSKAHAVYKFTRDGEKLVTIGIPGEPGDDNRHLKMPTDMVEFPSGEVFISDGYRNNRIVVSNAQGTITRTWGELGTGPGEFSLPHSIDRDSKGRLYVADRNNSRIQVFSEDGTFVDQWTNLCQPWTVRVTSEDEVYICGASPTQWREEYTQLGIPPKDQIVMKFDTTGRVLAWWRFPQGPDEVDSGVKPGELSWVHGLAIDLHGNLYLGDIMGQRAQRFLITN